MTSRLLQFPIFQNPGKDYDRRYFEGLIRSLNTLLTILRNPGEGRNSLLVLPTIQSTDVGYEPGTLFQIDGIVHVSVLYKSYVLGSSMSGNIGTVSVTVV
jgi:hypothetical protein